jgi:hypothetical protein
LILQEFNFLSCISREMWKAYWNFRFMLI